MQLAGVQLVTFSEARVCCIAPHTMDLNHPFSETVFSKIGIHMDVRRVLNAIEKHLAVHALEPVSH